MKVFRSQASREEEEEKKIGEGEKLEGSIEPGSQQFSLEINRVDSIKIAAPSEKINETLLRPVTRFSI